VWRGRPRPRFKRSRRDSRPRLPAFIADIAAYLVYQTERVELVSKIRLSRDPEDDVFLETAVDGRATFLVTGDKTDLLSLEAVGGIPIISASEAVTRLELLP
jgi:predicted nucleic acid-binding protein